MIEQIQLPLLIKKNAIQIKEDGPKDESYKPQWFAFDEKNALANWESDISLHDCIEVVYKDEAENIDKNDLLPEWFEFSESEATTEDENIEQSTDNNIPEWFSFSESNDTSEAKPTINTEDKTEKHTDSKHIEVASRKKDISTNMFFGNINSQKTETSRYNTQTTLTPEAVIMVDYDAQASKGLSKIAVSLDSMDFVTKAIATHMAACNGIDGHKAKLLNSTTIAQARETAIFNVMNTAIGQKLSKGEDLTEKDQQILDEIVSKTYESTLGIDTSNIRNNGVNLSDLSQVQMMMTHIIPPHEHGAGCDHNGSMSISSGSISFGNPSIFSDSTFESIIGKKDHDHHDKLFFCSNCKKSHAIHVHNKKDAVCPKCKSSNLREVKREHSH